MITFTDYTFPQMQHFRITCIIILLMCSFHAQAHEGEHAALPERFLENKGQWPEIVKYKVELGGGDFYLENNAFTYHFYDLYNVHPWNPLEASRMKGHNFRMRFIGANPSPSFETGAASFTDYNYFYGKNPESWVSGAKAYSSIKYHRLYEGIDLKIYQEGDQIKYDFLLEAGVDPLQIKMDYDGVNDLLVSDGQLQVLHDLGSVTEQKPYAFQVIHGQEVEVPCEFKINSNTVSFSFPKGYDSNYPLTIDPTLIFSTFSGSRSDNWGMTATYDEFGNAYNGGTVFAPGYLFPTGGYDTTYNNTVADLITDVAIRKYSSDGSQIYFSTYLGGNSSELVHSMIVNDSNQLVVFGVTGSMDFPVLNAYQSTFQGGNTVEALAGFPNGTDIYVTKFSADGHSIIGSTYVGGTDNDGLNYTGKGSGPSQPAAYGDLMYNYGDPARGEIELGKHGNIYIASQTHSSDFPIVNGIHTSLQGPSDAVLLKLSPDLSNLMYSSFFGGAGAESGVSVKIDHNNNIFMAGGTTSTDFPTTPNALETTYQGGIADGYILKIDSSGQNLLASTFVGTSDYDQIFNIDVDRFGEPYFFAQSKGGGFPVINAKYSVKNGAQLVGKLDSNLTKVIYSTKIGNLSRGGEGNGFIDITPTAFMVDRCQNLYISGWGGRLSGEINRPALQNMPLTPDAFKSTTHGKNFYIAVLSRGADSLMFATYFGGPPGSQEHVDGGTSRFDQRGVVYQSVCAGCHGNSLFITKNALYPKNGSNLCNNAIFKFDVEILPKAKFTVSRDTGCAPLNIQFTDESLRSNHFFWDLGDGDTTSSIKNPSKNFSTAGTYLIKLGVTDTICQSTDTAYKYIVVYPALTGYSVSNDTVVCNMDSIPIQINSKGEGVRFVFSNNRSFSDTLNSSLSDSTLKVLPKSGSSAYYYIKAATNGRNCEYIDSVWVKYMPYQSDLIPPLDSLCTPVQMSFKGVNIGATSYGFSFNDGSSFPQKGDITKTFTEAGKYEGYFFTGNSFCNLADTFRFDFTIFPGIEARTTNDTTICYGESIKITGSGQGNANTFYWSEEEDFGSTLNQPADSSIIFTTTQKRDTLYFKAASDVCADSTVFHLDMEQVLLDIDGPAMLCVGDTAVLQAVDMSNVAPISLQWIPSSEVISGQGSTRITISPAADVELLLAGESPFHCVDTALHFIEVNIPRFNSANISATQDTIFKGQSTSLSLDLTDPSLEFEWAPINSLSNPKDKNTVATPDSTTDYTIEIYDPVTGCTITAEKRIVVQEVNCGEPEIFIPTAFSPNGDLVNDVFEVRGRIIEDLSFSIYNRWGEKVFEGNGPAQTWDGKYKGQTVDPGVFVYHLNLTCFDGQKFFKKGNVTVIQ